MDHDVEVIAAHAERVLPLAIARLGDEYFYQSLPLCVIDAVYSIGVRYSGVQRVVARYCEWSGLRTFRTDRRSLPLTHEQESIAVFCERAEQIGPAAMADAVFGNRQRTSPRAGVLKAEAVYRFASVLRAHRVHSFQDVPTAADDARLESDIRSIAGQGSGISLRYFWMLAGSDEFIKPDRMILRFLHSVLGQPVSPGEAQLLLKGAAQRLQARFPNITPRLLDHEVWKYQREQGERVDSVGNPTQRSSGPSARDARTPAAERRRSAESIVICLWPG